MTSRLCNAGILLPQGQALNGLDAQINVQIAVRLAIRGPQRLALCVIQMLCDLFNIMKVRIDALVQ